MPNIKPIETKYKGYRFRSRLEARWAVAFDSVGIKWEYEPEGFDLDGIMYLPDFRLTNVRHRSCFDEFAPVWVEVKGWMTSDDLEKIKRFTGYNEEAMTGENPLLVIGNPLDGEWPEWDIKWPEWDYSFMDGDEYPAYFSMYKGQIWIAGPDHDNFDCGQLMTKMINAAKQARFEHGEDGTNG